MEPIEIHGEKVTPGQRRRIEIPVARLPTETWMSMTVDVAHGKQDGPSLWISAAVHGDELNGVEIVRRVMEQIDVDSLRGTLIAVPIVNVFGFINQSRYLPDRRDLNRCFPGSREGSLASRLAKLFMTEVVAKCSYGIDLHTGSNHRTNLPQIRADLNDPTTRKFAQIFGAPVMINSQTRDGSLRHAAANLKKTVLVYEVGEPLRFDFPGITLGVAGVLRIMSALEIYNREIEQNTSDALEIENSRWVRARRSGLIQLKINLGDHVKKNQRIAVIADAFGDDPVTHKSPCSGIVIGYTNNPLVNQGDAVVHIAETDQAVKEQSD